MNFYYENKAHNYNRIPYMGKRGNYQARPVYGEYRHENFNRYQPYPQYSPQYNPHLNNSRPLPPLPTSRHPPPLPTSKSNQSLETVSLKDDQEDTIKKDFSESEDFIDYNNNEDSIQGNEHFLDFSFLEDGVEDKDNVTFKVTMSEKDKEFIHIPNNIANLSESEVKRIYAEIQSKHHKDKMTKLSDEEKAIKFRYSSILSNNTKKYKIKVEKIKSEYERISKRHLGSNMKNLNSYERFIFDSMEKVNPKKNSPRRVTESKKRKIDDITEYSNNLSNVIKKQKEEREHIDLLLMNLIEKHKKERDELDMRYLKK